MIADNLSPENKQGTESVLRAVFVQAMVKIIVIHHHRTDTSFHHS